LRSQIAQGTAALDRGDFTELDERDLGAFMAELTAPRRAPRRRRAR
jgi:hypothetical protein